MCHDRFGVDVPGRQPGEATLCDPCSVVHMLELQLGQARHLLEMLNNGELTREQFDSFVDYIDEY